MFLWLNFLTYAIITAATPGPNNLMSMSNAGKLGFRKSLPFNFGVWFGFSIVMFFCTFFVGLLSAFLPKIELPIRILGASYMLYLAWGTYTSSSEIEEKQSKASFLSGVLLQFVNPKAYIYCIVSMEAYIFPYFRNQPLIIFSFAMLLVFIGFAFTVCWSAFGSIFKLLFSKYAKITNTIMALLLVYCALSLFL